MFECKWCGKEVAPGLEYCQSCGQPFHPTRECPRCGLEMRLDSRLCMNCGAIQEAPVQLSPTQGGTVAPSGGELQRRQYGATTTVGGVAAEEKPLWMEGARMDPFYVAAVCSAILSFICFWMPWVGIIISCLSLIFAAAGFIRYFKAPGMYGHVWVNIAAAVLALVALVISIRSTTSAEHFQSPAFILFFLIGIF